MLVREGMVSGYMAIVNVKNTTENECMNVLDCEIGRDGLVRLSELESDLVVLETLFEPCSSKLGELGGQVTFQVFFVKTSMSFCGVWIFARNVT
jgi:hypothetical protein